MDINKVASALQQSYAKPIDFGSSPFDDGNVTSQLKNVQAVESLMGQGDRARYASGAIGGVAAEDESQRRQRERVALAEAQAKLESKEKQMADKTDPDKYQKLVNDRGGYDFYTPDGKPISAVEYARATNKRLTDILKDSEYGEDRDFIEDYERLIDLRGIMRSNDKEARDKFMKENPEFSEYVDLPYQDIVSGFKALYSDYIKGREGESPALEGSKLSNVGNAIDDRGWFDKVKDILPGGSSRGWNNDSQVNPLYRR